MDKVKAQTIINELEALVSQIEEKHGVKFQFKGGRITENSLIPKMEISQVSNDGIIKDKHHDALNAIYPEFVGKKLKDGKIVVGYNSRSWKFPFIVQDPSGKKWKMTEDHINSLS